MQPLFVHLAPTDHPRWWPGPAEDQWITTRANLSTPTGRQQLHQFLTRCDGLTCLGENDAHWLRQLTPPLPCPLWLPPSAALIFLESKTRQAELAKECGFSLLPTHHADLHHCPTIPPEQFPLVARPDGSGTTKPNFKVHILATPQELTRWLNCFSAIHRPLMLQPLIHGPNLVIHAAADAQGHPLALQGFRVRRKFEGVTLTLEPMPLDPALAQACRLFCQRAGLHGCLHFELIQDEHRNTPWFLEVNGRLGGTTGKAYAAGFDEPRLLLVAHGALPAAPLPPLPEDRVITNRLALGKLLLQMARRAPGLQGDPSGLPRRWKDLLPGMWLWKDEIFQWSDPATTLWYYGTWLRERLTRGVHPT